MRFIAVGAVGEDVCGDDLEAEGADADSEDWADPGGCVLQAHALDYDSRRQEHEARPYRLQTGFGPEGAAGSFGAKVEDAV